MEIGNLINRSSKLKKRLTEAVEALERGETITARGDSTFWQVVGSYESRFCGLCIYRVKTSKFMDNLTDRYVAAKKSNC